MENYSKGRNTKNSEQYKGGKECNSKDTSDKDLHQQLQDGRGCHRIHKAKIKKSKPQQELCNLYFRPSRLSVRSSSPFLPGVDWLAGWLVLIPPCPSQSQRSIPITSFDGAMIFQLHDFKAISCLNFIFSPVFPQDTKNKQMFRLAASPTVLILALRWKID